MKRNNTGTHADQGGMQVSFSQQFKSWLFKNAITVILVVAAIIVGLRVPYFFSWGNLVNVLLQSAALGLMTIGIANVLITGGTDLSLPPVMALSAIVGVICMRNGCHPALGAIVMLAVGSVFGLFNGFAVAYLNMIPFVVTLSTAAIAEGLCVWVTGARSVSGVPESFSDAVLQNVFGLPMAVIILLISTIIVQIMMSRSVPGRWLYAVGTNPRTARVCGVPVRKVVLSSYILSGLLAGLAGIVMSARFASASATMGQSSAVLDIISSAVVGGVSAYGGSGTAVGAVLGAIVITLISNAMNLLQVSYYMTLVIKGCVIIAVVAADAFQKRKGGAVR